jgi:tryptophan synthase beta chain
MLEAEAIGQVECFERAVQFARAEGIIPAPEPTHAIAAAVREALAAKASGEEKVILTALCGHGHFDMGAYRAFLDGVLEDYEYPEEAVAESMARIPAVN